MSEIVITLKWGTLKGWSGVPEGSKAFELLRKYHKEPTSWGCASQKDTPSQKQILMELVSLPEIHTYLDWDGKWATHEEALAYIRDYGKESK